MVLAADLLQADGASVHLVHPVGLHWDSRRVKNDERDAAELAHRESRAREIRAKATEAVKTLEVQPSGTSRRMGLGTFRR